jgi:FeS assembly SUF system protein
MHALPEIIFSAARAKPEHPEREMTRDPEYERLKTRRILPVLNRAAATTDAFVLEDEGKKPEPSASAEELSARVIEALRTVHDPEIPLNIYDLGLIYGLDVDQASNVHLRMTLTAPGCPVAGSLVREVHDKLVRVPGVRHAKTELVWDPPWSRDRLTDAAKLTLGLF